MNTIHLMAERIRRIEAFFAKPFGVWQGRLVLYIGPPGPLTLDIEMKRPADVFNALLAFRSGGYCEVEMRIYTAQGAYRPLSTADAIATVMRYVADGDITDYLDTVVDSMTKTGGSNA